MVGGASHKEVEEIWQHDHGTLRLWLREPALVEEHPIIPALHFIPGQFVRLRNKTADRFINRGGQLLGAFVERFALLLALLQLFQPAQQVLPVGQQAVRQTGTQCAQIFGHGV
jgi:hypothetical protein